MNLLDGAAHFYDTYECADGKFVAIGAIEPQFYALLLDAVGLTDDPEFAAQMDPARWPALKARLNDVFRTRTRDEWSAIMEGSDICYAPILSLAEAPGHDHNVARGTFGDIGGQLQPMPAPRYAPATLDPPRPPVAATDAILTELGLADRIAELRAAGTVG